MRGLFRSRKHRLKELDEELESHLQTAIRDRIDQGERPEKAEETARAEFGNSTMVREATRDTWGGRWISDFKDDARFALRTLRRSPGFAVVAVLTLALGIGVNTAIFSVLDAVLLRSLPYPDSSRIVLLWGVESDSYSSLNDRSQISATDLMDWRKQNAVFEDVAAYSNWSPTLTGRGDARRISAMLVGDGYFSILRAKPILGRTFTPDENIDGNDKEVVVSYGFWQRDLGSDPGAVGETLVLNGVVHTIVGVLPESFRSLPASLLTIPAAELYRPVGENYDPKMRSARHLRGIARLKPGVKLEQAQTNMSLITSRLTAQYPSDDTGYGVRVIPMKEDLVGSLRPALLALFGAASFVLLIACVNVGGLLLARSATRQREIALRCALGASRIRLLRQMLTESVLLSLTGGVAGVTLAIATTKWISVLGAQVFPEIADVSTSAGVLAFTLFAAVASGILFGIVPARQASQLDPNIALKENARSIVGAGGVRRVLIVAEIALAMVLVVGAGLMIRSIVELYRLDPGFVPSRLISMDFVLPDATYKDDARRVAFAQTLLAKAAAIPGTKSIALTSLLPLGGNFDGRAIIVMDKPRPDGQEFSVGYYAVSPSYFDTMKIPLVTGRYFTDDDRAGHTPVVIVSETAARNIWPGENPLGKQMRAPSRAPELAQEPWSTVVGVVHDVQQFALDRPGTMQLYGAEWQVGFSNLTIVARTGTNPDSLVRPIRRSLQSLDSNLALSNVATMDELVANSMGLRRLAMALLVGFAGLALGLASVGIYGLVSYSVVQRTSEIGIRAALGAQSGDILRLVLANAAGMAIIGIMLGSIVALVAMRFLSALLYRIRSYDPLTFGTVALILSAVALSACLVPAWRAIRVDPTAALRHE